MGADKVTLTPFCSAVNAQKPDNVPVIGVEELARCRAVDANLVGLRRIIADVLDVPQDVATAVLGEEVADVSSKTHVGYGRLVGSPCCSRKTLEKDEAFSVEEVFAEVGEGFAKTWEREEVLKGKI